VLGYKDGELTMVDRSVMKINNVTINSNVATNILDLDYEFVIQDKVRHTPNVVAGLGIRNYPKFHRITLIFDSVTDIFDSYISEAAKNTVIPSGSIDLEVYNHTTGLTQTETWTLEANKAWVAQRGELRVEKLQERKPWQVVLICIGTLAITFA
jgi:hypothetical protein